MWMDFRNRGALRSLGPIALVGTAAAVGFLPFVAAFPFSILLLPLLKALPPLIVFGVCGTLWWFVLSKTVSVVAARLAGRHDR